VPLGFGRLTLRRDARPAQSPASANSSFAEWRLRDPGGAGSAPATGECQVRGAAAGSGICGRHSLRCGHRNDYGSDSNPVRTDIVSGSDQGRTPGLDWDELVGGYRSWCDRVEHVAARAGAGAAGVPSPGRGAQGERISLRTPKPRHRSLATSAWRSGVQTGSRAALRQIGFVIHLLRSERPAGGPSQPHEAGPGEARRTTQAAWAQWPTGQRADRGDDSFARKRHLGPSFACETT
jgi:hypothetical protein